jgi:hypothetical protein
MAYITLVVGVLVFFFSLYELAKLKNMFKPLLFATLGALIVIFSMAEVF